MSAPIVFMYSGQGAQYYQMGKELFETNDTFKKALTDCSDIVEPLVGASLVDQIYSGTKSQPFEPTRYTHPANVAIAYALTQVLYDQGIRPDYLLGYSLGEYACALVGGAISLESAMQRIARQALTLEELTPEGCMLAILEDPGMHARRPDLFMGTTLACYNFATHFVVTGTRDVLNRLETKLQNEDITTQMLPISLGFHSPMIEPGREAVIEQLDGAFGPQELPTYSCMLRSKVSQFSGEHMWNVLRNPVQFFDTIKSVEAELQPTYIDVGASGTMATFVKYALGRAVTPRALMTINQFGRDQKSMDMLLRGLGR